MEKKLPIFKLTINPDDETGVDFVALVDNPAIEKNWVAFAEQSWNDYPQEAVNNAKRALKWADKNGWGDCGEQTGKVRANQIANKEKLTRDTIARISGFRRHQQNKNVPYNEGCGGLMWDAWGGDAMIDWAERKLKEIDKQFKFKSLEPEKRIISGALMVADLPIYRSDNKFGEYYVVFDRPTIEQIVFKFFRNGYVGNANAMHDKNQKLNGVYMIESFIIDSQKGINTPLGHDDLPDGSWFGSFKVDNEEVWNEFIKTGKFKGFSVEGLFDQELLTQQPEDEIESVIQQIHNLTDMLNKIAQNK